MEYVTIGKVYEDRRESRPFAYTVLSPEKAETKRFHRQDEAERHREGFISHSSFPIGAKVNVVS